MKLSSREEKDNDRSENDDSSDEEEDDNDDDDGIHIQTENDTNDDDDSNDANDLITTHTSQPWQTFRNFKPEIAPKLPKAFRQVSHGSAESTLDETQDLVVGQWPTYIHLPVQLIKGDLLPNLLSNSKNDNDEKNEGHSHHLGNKVTCLSEEQLHISVTPTRLFSYGTCMQIANILYEQSARNKKKKSNNGSMTRFQTRSMGVLRNVHGASNLLYLVHYVDEEAPIVNFVHSIQKSLVREDDDDNENDENDSSKRPSNRAKPFFDLLDDWNVHITVGKYDTMGNVSEEQVIEWTSEIPQEIDPSSTVEWEWNRSIVMYCGNKKFIWDCSGD